MASFIIIIRTVYSDWHVNNKTVAYSFNFYEIGPLFNMNTKPDTKCLVVLFCPQLVSLVTDLIYGLADLLSLETQAVWYAMQEGFNPIKP